MILFPLAKSVFVVLVFSLLGGCVSTADLKRRGEGWDNLESKVQDFHRDTPSVVKVKLSPNSFDVTHIPFVLPKEMDVDTSVEFAGTDLDKALYAISAYTKVNIFLSKGALAGQKQQRGQQAASSGQTQPQSQPQPQQFTGGAPQNLLQRNMGSSVAPSQVQSLQSKKISIRYKGQLSGLLDLISENTGSFFRLKGDTILVSDQEIFSFVVPAYPKLLEEVESNILALGAQGVSYDRLTSMVTFSADYYAYKQIRAYCDKLKANASLVTLRILLLNISLFERSNMGIDWSKMVLGGGGQKPMKLGYSKAAQGAGGVRLLKM